MYHTLVARESPQPMQVAEKSALGTWFIKAWRESSFIIVVSSLTIWAIELN